MPGVRPQQLNKAQAAAVLQTEGPLLIVAGAGTGKTRVITERILHLLLDKKVPASKILALTFTEKAAQEMIDRVDEGMPLSYEEVAIKTFHGFCDAVLR
jgi:DNA helicase-2/ATP-dependent DNA helicase PcrA